MKIAYLSTFYPYRGGIAQFNSALYREFEKRAEIRAFTFTRQYPNILFPGKSQYVAADDPADKVPAERLLDTINPLTYFKTGRAISRFGPDLLLTKFWMPFFAPGLGKAAQIVGRSGAKRIAILDNVIPHEKRPGDVALIKYFLKRYDGFVTMSKAVETDLLKLKPDASFISRPHPLYDIFGKPVSKMEARARLGLPEGARAALFFGFIRDYKGLDLALEALARLDNRYYLIIAGEPYGDFSKYEKQIDSLGLRDRAVIRARYISDDETPEYFSAADVCLLPYKSATQSGIVAVSYNFDLPVVATNTGGLAEMIEPYGAGVMAGEPTAENIARALEKFFDEGGASTFAENIRAAKKDMTWSALADAIINFSKK